MSVLSTLRVIPMSADTASVFTQLFEHPSIHPAYAARGDAALYLGFPHYDPAGSFLVYDGETPVAFAFSIYVYNHEPPFTQVSVGVLPSHRGRGLGRALVDHVEAHYGDRIAFLRMGADVAVPGGDLFAHALGFTEERHFWTMQRPFGPVPAIEWPDGIECRGFDGGDAMLEDFGDAATRSFADNWGFVAWTLDMAREEIARPGFRRDGLLLAYRDGAVVGLSFNTILPDGRGEVDTLGVVASERGRGLGRALLRWGVEWLQAQQPRSVILLVDGANDSATRLYRAEGFIAIAERVVWKRASA